MHMHGQFDAMLVAILEETAWFGCLMTEVRCTSDAYDEACEKERSMGTILNSKDVLLSMRRSTWRLLKKVGKEKVIDGEYCLCPFATAVCHCVDHSGPCEGRKDFLKIYVQ